MKSSSPDPARPAFALGRRFAALLLIAILIVGIGFCSKREEPDGAEAILAGETPLAKAAALGDIQEITQLLDDNDVDAKDTLGRTPLHIAAFYGNVKASAFLISKGADINAQDRVGMTPLHVAVISGGRREVNLLVEEKADISLRTASGQTVLHLSAATGQPKLTRFLIDSGADPMAEDSKGKNPLFYAVKNSHPQTAAVLRQFMPKEKKKPANKKNVRIDKNETPPIVPAPSTQPAPASSAPSPVTPTEATGQKASESPE